MKPYPEQDPAFDTQLMYTKPIASRVWILSTLHHHQKAVGFETFVSCFNYHTEDQKQALASRLHAMVRQSQLCLTAKGQYYIDRLANLYVGSIHSHRDGFGFFSVSDDDVEDAFICQSQMQMLMDGDQAMALVTPSKRDPKRLSANIIDVTKRHHRSIVCQLLKQDDRMLAIPCQQNIVHPIILDQTIKGMKSQDFLEVCITQYPSRYHGLKGVPTRLIGSAIDRHIEIDVASAMFNLKTQWQPSALSQVKNLNKHVHPNRLKHHIDWQDLPFVTIDGKDAKDFDDAIYAEKNDDGFILYVAIADVSHYVDIDSPLDEAAYQRSTSIYLPSKVIPMLPFALSNDLCSLLPGRARLVLGLCMHINAKGHCTSYQFNQAVIRSHARMTYEQVHDMIQAHVPTPPWFTDSLRALTNCFDCLYQAQEKRGAIEFNRNDCVWMFDKQGRIKDVKVKSRLITHQIVEQCMLIANQMAAKFLLEHDQPALFRVHPKPDGDKLDLLNAALKSLGKPTLTTETIHTTHLANILRDYHNKNSEKSVQAIILRSLKFAYYQPNNIGHFGLAYDHYCHFTSPIRRYPDLITHRCIKGLIHGNTSPYTHQQLEKIGQHCSQAQRQGDLASMYVQNWLKCHFMVNKTKVYDAHVVNITSFGLIIQLNTLFVEGLIHISQLSKDYYIFDKASLTLTGQQTGHIWYIGQRLRAKVKNIDFKHHTIDFKII